MTEVFVEQPLASPGSAKNAILLVFQYKEDAIQPVQPVSDFRGGTLSVTNKWTDGRNPRV